LLYIVCCSTTKSKCVSDAALSLSLTWSLPDVADTDVSCVFMERCILPYQFGYQHQIYRNRASLFKDQLSRGNASLQLTGVKVQDEGRYRCFIKTINGEKFILFNLELLVTIPASKLSFFPAAVHDINIQQVENRITCSSEGIYPQPELTWSTTPPSNINLLYSTTVQQNEQQLYSISSSLILSPNDTDLLYSCTISTPTNRRRAFDLLMFPCSSVSFKQLSSEFVSLTVCLFMSQLVEREQERTGWGDSFRLNQNLLLVISRRRRRE
uniref:Ig-like domain-containing protein n=1 Tax=Amphiprion ocellaris TaxID=80972 RepID=A0AAQ5Z9X9_AMPOC